MKKERKHYGSLTIFNIIAILISVQCVAPLIWLLYSSFKTKEEFLLNPISLPKGIEFNNYIKAFES